MKRHWLAVAGSFVLLLGAPGCAPTAEFCVCLERSERSIERADVPDAALAVMEAEAGAFEIVEYEEETRCGEPVYEAEWRWRTGEAEVTVTAAGAVIEREQDVSPAEVPAAVRAAAQLLASGNAEIGYAAREFVFYEIEIVTPDGEREYLLDPTGRVLRQSR